MTTKTKKKTRRPRPSELPTGCMALLSQRQVAASLSVSIRHFRKMLAAGQFPPPDTTKLGTSLPRWHVDTVNDFIDGLCEKGE